MVEFTVTYSLGADPNGSVAGLFLFRAFDANPTDSTSGTPVLVHDPDYYRGNFTRGKSVNIQFANVTWDPVTWDPNNPDSGDVIGPFDIVVDIVNVASGQRTSRTYAANPLCL